MASAKKRILAADDDATALSALRQILAQRGYDVTIAGSGEEALRIAALQEFDLFILDVTMPGVTGFDVCKQLRQDPRSENTPVIFLTAKGMIGDMMQGREAGSDLYLVKPVLGSKILSMVGMFLSSEIPLAKKSKADRNRS
ncbi:MAG: response regulator transcription factor [Vicinamibacteria bacterium]